MQVPAGSGGALQVAPGSKSQVGAPSPATTIFGSGAAQRVCRWYHGHAGIATSRPGSACSRGRASAQSAQRPQRPSDRLLLLCSTGAIGCDRKQQRQGARGASQRRRPRRWRAPPLRCCCCLAATASLCGRRRGHGRCRRAAPQWAATAAAPSYQQQRGRQQRRASQQQRQRRQRRRRCARAAAAAAGVCASRGPTARAAAPARCGECRLLPGLPT